MLTNSTITSVLYQLSEPLEILTQKAQHYTNILTKQASDLSNKTKCFVKYHLSSSVLKQKAQEALKAKILPLSAPPEFTKRIKSLNRRIALLKEIKKQRADSLACIKDQYHLSVPTSLKNAGLKIKLQSAKDEYKKIDLLLDSTQKVKAYFQNKKRFQIGGRFSSYFGMASNIVIPGSGKLVGTLVTGVNTLIQEQLIKELEKTLEYELQEIEQEKQAVRTNTLITLVCSVASLTFLALVIPFANPAS